MTRRPLLHSVIQVRGYCEYLADFLGVLEGDEGAIKGAAYLHNATEHGISDLRALRLIEKSEPSPPPGDPWAMPSKTDEPPF
jgi:hypothetical protein